MKMRHKVLLFQLVTLPWLVSGYQVHGTITNGTTEQPLAHYPVALKKYAGQEEQIIAADTTDGAGNFSFDGLQENGTYGVYLAYQIIKYDDVRWEEPSPADQPIQLTVYDTTRSDANLKIAMQHTILKEGEGLLLVQQMMRVVNTGNKAFIGTVPVSRNAYKTLSFQLPDDATNIRPGKGFMQCCVGLDQDGFYDTMEVLPGSKDVVLSYQIPVESEQYRFQEEIPYPVDSYVALVKRQRTQVSSRKLDRLETAGDQSVVQLAAGGLQQGTVIPIQFDNFLQPSQDYGAYFIGLFVIVLAGGIFLAQRGKHNQHNKAKEKTMPYDPVCHMPVPEEDQTYTTTYQGETYYFCCEGCQEQFEKHPEEYVDSGEWE